MNDLERPSP